MSFLCATEDTDCMQSQAGDDLTKTSTLWSSRRTLPSTFAFCEEGEIYQMNECPHEAQTTEEKRCEPSRQNGQMKDSIKRKTWKKNLLWCKDRDAEHIKIKLAMMMMMIRDGHGKNVNRMMWWREGNWSGRMTKSKRREEERTTKSETGLWLTEDCSDGIVFSAAEISVRSRGRWAGPPAAGSGPGWAGWTQSCRCYCESDLLKEARRTGRLEAGERGGRGRSEWNQERPRKGEQKKREEKKYTRVSETAAERTHLDCHMRSAGLGIEQKTLALGMLRQNINIMMWSRALKYDLNWFHFYNTSNLTIQEHDRMQKKNHSNLLNDCHNKN